MSDYINFNDVKAVIINLVCGVAVIVAYRYWSNRTITSLNRRIQQIEQQKKLVENLATSERAVLLFGFQAVFGLLAVMAAIFALTQILLPIGERGLALGITARGTFMDVTCNLVYLLCRTH